VTPFSPSTPIAFDADATTVALFCVEREPAACHRSLVAERWQQDLGGQVIHLLPPSP